MTDLSQRLDRPIVLVGLMGVGKSTVGRRLARRLHEENQLLMRNYLGLMRGRVYYNLMTWYASMSHFPFALLACRLHRQARWLPL